MLLLLLQVGLLLLVTTRANPPLTIFGNEYVFSTFHYPTDPNAGKAHREEYARKVTLQYYCPSNIANNELNNFFKDYILPSPPPFQLS
jgi:hypothetical protein